MRRGRGKASGVSWCEDGWMDGVMFLVMDSISLLYFFLLFGSWWSLGLFCPETFFVHYCLFPGEASLCWSRMCA